MDTHFYSSLGSYSWDARSEMVAELGYDSTYLTLWNDRSWHEDLPRLGETQSRFGITVQGVYAMFDMAHAADSEREVLSLLATLEGTSTIDLAIRDSRRTHPPTSPQSDLAIATMLARLLRVADDRGIDILLYAHRRFYLDRIEQSVQFARALDHERLGVSFSAFHWYANGEGEIDARLEDAAPYLRSANLCGLTRTATPTEPDAVRIEPLDTGELDNFALLAALRRAGFAGPIGMQGFSIGGDPYSRLQRSLETFRQLEQRLLRHPGWGDLRPPAA